MNRFTRILGVALLGAAALIVCPQTANAGRVGGPTSEVGTIAANDTISFDVPFLGGESAIVSVTGNGSTNLELYIYDADGHVSTGVGIGDRKMASMNVYRAGFFRVEVRNLGPVANDLVISTN